MNWKVQFKIRPISTESGASVMSIMLLVTGQTSGKLAMATALTHLETEYGKIAERVIGMAGDLIE